MAPRADARSSGRPAASSGGAARGAGPRRSARRGGQRPRPERRERDDSPFPRRLDRAKRLGRPTLVHSPQADATRDAAGATVGGAARGRDGAMARIERADGRTAAEAPQRGVRAGFSTRPSRESGETPTPASREVCAGERIAVDGG